MSITNSKATIISYNIENEHICASAARISTRNGNALDIYNMMQDPEKDRVLIGNVLKSEHMSIIEHAYFTIAFCNVSAVVEQFFIEFRLASFTIKSRRYVDFGQMGYYLPEGLDLEYKEIYKNHMEYLFLLYNYFIQHNIPKEDARFILPYSFFSNFYCTLNARELIYIIDEILNGRGKGNEELRNLAIQLIDQLSDIFPVALKEINNSITNIPENIIMINNIREQEIVNSSVKVIDSKQDVNSLMLAYFISHGYDLNNFQDFIEDSNKVSFIIGEILKEQRQRELEHISYTFLIQNLSLSGITHIVRHRMQSIIIPPLLSTRYNRYIIPESILSNNDLVDKYKNAFSRNVDVVEKLSRSIDSNLLVYFCLSGNTLDVISTMNIRELKLFFKLRCCNRAQWEIRNIATDMLCQLRATIPSIFNYLGPSCITEDRCPEGNLTCGQIDRIREKFSYY